MKDDPLIARLLDADPAELNGSADTEISRLVRDDPRAGLAARRILAALRDANTAMERIAADRSSVGPRLAARDPGWSTNREPRPMPGLRRLLAGGLAVAALIMALVAMPNDRPVAPAPSGSAGSLDLTAQLAAASSRPFAVFATDNPDIAIVWLFDEEEQ